MKILSILSHPVLLISSFCLILISGEHWGGFYLLYVLMALPHFGLHALLAVAGMLLLLISLLQFKQQQRSFIEPILNIAGASSIVLSLAFFFANDKKGYNDGTFEQVIPLLSLGLFVLLVILFVVRNIFFFRSSPSSLRKV